MQIDVFTQLISNIGFPIAICCWFMWTMNKQLDDFRTVIENNTKAITELCARGAGQ